MAFDLKMFGNKLKKCRDNLQLTLDEVSARTGIGLSRLESFENGALEPNGDDVLIFADLYKQHYNYFISNQQKTAFDEIDILYRKYGDDFTKEDRLAIQEFIFLCEAEHFVLKELEFKPLDFESKPTGDYFKGHGQEAAKQLRSKLHLKDDQIVRDPYATMRKLGIHVFRRKLANSEISGLFINHPFAVKTGKADPSWPY